MLNSVVSAHLSEGDGWWTETGCIEHVGEKRTLLAKTLDNGREGLSRVEY
jgi:hypothetical protein